MQIKINASHNSWKSKRKQIKMSATKNECNSKRVQIKMSANQNECNSKRVQLKTNGTQNECNSKRVQLKMSATLNECKSKRVQTTTNPYTQILKVFWKEFTVWNTNKKMVMCKQNRILLSLWKIQFWVRAKNCIWLSFDWYPSQTDFFSSVRKTS